MYKLVVVFSDCCDLLNAIFTYSLQLGDYALFTPDKYGNYLAVTVDGKHYYLDKKSATTFTVTHELPCKLKLLFGKITSRVHCEVKKVSILSLEILTVNIVFLFN